MSKNNLRAHLFLARAIVPFSRALYHMPAKSRIIAQSSRTFYLLCMKAECQRIIFTHTLPLTHESGTSKNNLRAHSISHPQNHIIFARILSLACESGTSKNNLCAPCISCLRNRAPSYHFRAHSIFHARNHIIIVPFSRAFYLLPAKSRAIA